MRILVFVCLLLGAGAAGADAPAATDDCEGRNPLYCGQDGELLPPGACEGRNPRYCKEQPAPKPKLEQPEPRPGRASVDGNPNRNPNRNPNQNPNRRPPRRSASD